MRGFRPVDLVLLAILSLVYGVQYLDQILLGLILQPIKAEFSLSDTQAGLLTGAAFTLLYVMLGLPVARIADRGNRKRIILLSTIIFSLATLSCGWAVGFLSLFIMRMLVAVGEAGTLPASVSILADVFPPAKRRLAMSFHSCGGYLGSAIGMLFVGLASGILSWRYIFGVAGAMGLFLALCVALVVREPARGTKSPAPMAFFQDLRKLLAIRSYVLIILALGMISISSSAAINWVPAFLARSHGMEQRDIVLFMAAVWGIAATSGSVISGILTNWLYSKGGRWPLVVVGSLMVLFPAMCCLAFLVNSPALTLPLYGFAVFLMGGIRGPSFATVQDIVPAGCQATANALQMFSMYGIGVTLGPLLTGIASDALQATLGPEALRYALMVVIALAGIIAATLIYFAAIKLTEPSPKPSPLGSMDAQNSVANNSDRTLFNVRT